jgi:hypothetical protein
VATRSSRSTSTFVDHRLLIHTTAGRTASLSLPGQSVASFYDGVLSALGDLGIAFVIDRPVPFDLSDATPFAADTIHSTYDPVRVTRYWQVLSRVSFILEEFAGGSSGKTSPVHHFWHTFDIAVTRFSDRVVTRPMTVDPVTSRWWGGRRTRTPSGRPWPPRPSCTTGSHRHAPHEHDDPGDPLARRRGQRPRRAARRRGVPGWAVRGRRAASGFCATRASPWRGPHGTSVTGVSPVRPRRSRRGWRWRRSARPALRPAGSPRPRCSRPR